MAPEIANYLVTRLFDGSSGSEDTAGQLVSILLLDMVGAFPQASMHEYLQGVAIAAALVGWQDNPQHNEQLSVLASAIQVLVKP
jgi:hypothetical protein